MDRVLSKISFISLALLAAGTLLMSSQARADTVLIQPVQRPAPQAAAQAGGPVAPEARGPIEEFPPSRFGQPPMRVNTGVSDSYAANAVEDMESPDEDLTLHSQGIGFRSPAGLEFGTHAETVRAAMPSSRISPPKPGSIETAPVRLPDPVSEVSATASRNGVQEVSVIAGDLGFFPKTIFVSRDVPVRMFVTGASKNTLCIMMDSFQVRKQIRAQKIEEITFTPSTPGKYRFYCPVNGMEGTLIVKEFASAQPDAVAEEPRPAQAPTASSR